MINLRTIFLSLIIALILSENYAYPKRRDNKEKCPKRFVFLLPKQKQNKNAKDIGQYHVCGVGDGDILCGEWSSVSLLSFDVLQRLLNPQLVKALRNFNLSEMMGFWYIVQYYASSEDLPEYACMRSVFSNDVEDGHVTMNFTYVFSEDPTGEILQGNITWIIPSYDIPAHWIHTEDIYEGIYNTYVIDTDYKTWGLIMHCAEKTKSPRYLSALLISREPVLGVNVINFLREKLPKYDIDTSFMFPINQSNCDEITVGTGTLMKKSEYQIREYMEKQEKIKIFNNN